MEGEMSWGGKGPEGGNVLQSVTGGGGEDIAIEGRGSLLFWLSLAI